ncbi:MAG: tetratricopeptide repeat protein [Tannerella sp.]|jgi:tetratricopeptide (TPR) repeat protein|nr:tetratricopeptide repeat protein [Tannerella sp.]
MGLFDLFKKKRTVNPNESRIDDDDVFLQAEPVSRKRMDLLWLDTKTLHQLEQPVAQHGVITVTMGDNSNLRDHEITQEDYDWAKGIQQIIEEAFSAGQRGNHKMAIVHYKKALELAPGCDLFLMSIGSGYAHLGQKAKALKYLEKAAQISPGNSRIRNNLNNVRKM